METKSVILDVKFEGDPAKVLAELQSEVDRYKNSIKELSKDKEKNAVAIQRESLSLREAQRQYSSTRDQVEAMTKATGKNIMSIDSLNAANKAMRQELRKVDLSTEEGRKKVAELNLQIDKNTKIIKENSDSLVQQKMNIGNYSQSIIDAVDKTGLLSGVIRNAEEAQKLFSAAYAGGIQSLSAFATQGMSVTKVLQSMRVAIIGTGIGALVVALGALIAYLTSTQEGIDFVNRKLAGLKAITGVIIDTLSDLGELMFKAFNDPQQAIKDLGDLILTNLINRFKAVGEIVQALYTFDFPALTEATLQLYTGIEDLPSKTSDFADELNRARMEAEAVEAEFQRIEKAQISLNLKERQSAALISELRRQGMDNTLSLQKREEALNEAAKIQSELKMEQLKLQQDIVANLTRGQEITKNLLEDNKELANEVGKLADLEKELADFNRENERQLKEIRRAAAAQRQAQIQAQLALEKQLIDLRLAAMKDGIEKETEFEKERLKRALAEVKGTGKLQNEIRAALQEESERNLAMIRHKYRNKDLEEEIRGLQLKTLQFEKNTRERIDAETELILAQRNFLLQNEALTENERLLIKVEANNKILELEAAFLQAQNEERDKAAKLEQERIAKEKQQKQDLLDFELEMHRQRVESSIAATDAILSLLNEESEGFKVFKAIKKGLVISDIILNLQQELSALAVAAAANPLNAITAGAAGVSQLAIGKALAFARAAAGTAAVLKAERGASFYAINGKRHSSGGTKFYDEQGRAVFEAEQGETLAILKRGADKKLLPTLSRINQSVGGIDLSRPMKLENGGAFSITNQGVRLPQSGDIDIAAIIRNLPQPVVKVTDINRVNSNANMVEVLARL